MMTNRINSPPQIGDWYTTCCQKDLKQIEDEAELMEVIQDLAGDEARPEVWATQEDAMRELLARNCS